MKALNTLLIYLILWTSSMRMNAQTVPNTQVSETRYDYTEVAKSITEGCSTKMEQAQSIYSWICRHIAYDTDLRIYTADECYDHQKGVCQAYCELFYRLGEPLGLECIIISGKSKDAYGQIERSKHAWLFVEVEGGGILIDPTWGAGSINKEGKFVRSDNDMSWFHIDPHWLIFTHYPDDARFQFLENAIGWDTFTRLPALYPSSTEYGWDGKETLTRVLDGSIGSLPQIYDQFSGYLWLTDIPMQKTLRPGQSYSFTVGKKKANEIVLIHEDEFVHESEWQQNGNHYTLQFMPVSSGTVTLAISMGEKKYHAAVVYQVPAPTPADLKAIERHSPLRMPEIKRLKNLDQKKWEAIGADAHEMLKCVRQQRITALPILYKQAGKYLRDVEIPFSGTLKAGQSYTFSFIPQGGLEWQIINEDDWYGDWQIDESTGRHTMQIVPKRTGKFRLSVQLEAGGAFESMVGYDVK